MAIKGNYRCVRVHQMRVGEVISQTRKMHMSVKMVEYSDEWYNEARDHLIKIVDDYIKNGSGWIKKAIERGWSL